MHETELPNTETRITQAYFIRETIDKELESIIARTKTGAIAEISNSWIAAEHTVAPHGMSAILQLMQAMNNAQDISERIGWLQRYNMKGPLSISVQGDPRDHTHCRIFIEEGEPRIGIPEYWTERNHASIRAAYAKYCRSLTHTMGIPNMIMGIEAEREIAHQYPTSIERGDVYSRINMLTWKELTSEYTTIAWKPLFVAFGLTEEMLPRLLYNVTSPSFTHHLQSRMRNWNIERWRGWFSLIVTQWIAGCSPHGPLRSAWFAFTCRFMQGMKRDSNPDVLRAEVVRSLLPQTLGKLWTAEYCQPLLKRDVEKMVTCIQEAAARSLKRTTWMAEQTRREAIYKLRRMDVQIAWPTAWDDTEHGCTLTDENYVENLLTLSANRTESNIDKIRRGCAKRELIWNRPVYEVNAFYYPEQNRFVLPAAILRPPFYDKTRSAAWNYGGIGATIGHEFCHAFDSDGRKFDAHGDLRNWWTAADNREYMRRANRIIKLFDTATYRGMDVDGYLTQVENIADVGGLCFALAGLRLHERRPLTKAEVREFFTSYAVSWRSKDRYRKAAQLLETDPHAPPRLRVNQIVRQLDEWYDAFDIGPTHPSFIEPEKRIRFFS